MLPDGRSYNGNYKMNYRHGEGKLTLKDGSTLKGKWEVGQMVSFTFEEVSRSNFLQNGIFEYRHPANGKQNITFSKGKMITEDVVIGDYRF